MFSIYPHPSLPCLASKRFLALAFSLASAAICSVNNELHDKSLIPVVYSVKTVHYLHIKRLRLEYPWTCGRSYVSYFIDDYYIIL